MSFLAGTVSTGTTATTSSVTITSVQSFLAPTVSVDAFVTAPVISSTLSLLSGQTSADAVTAASLFNLTATFTAGQPSADANTLQTTFNTSTSIIPGQASGSANTAPQVLSSALNFLAPQVSCDATLADFLLTAIISFEAPVVTIEIGNKIIVDLDDLAVDISSLNQSDTGLNISLEPAVYFGNSKGRRGFDIEPTDSQAKILFGNKPGATPLLTSDYYLAKYKKKTLPELPGAINLGFGTVRKNRLKIQTGLH